MNAATIHGLRDIRLEDLPEPVPGPGQLLVRVMAAGICGTDLEIYVQEHPAYRTGRARFPIIPGHEWAGEVIAVGPEVTRFRPGDRVTSEVAIGCGQCETCMSGRENICPDRREFGIIERPGAFAEFTVTDEDRTHSIGALSFEEAALLEPATVAVRAVRLAEVEPGDKVAILGSGSIGLLAVQAAKAAGAGLVLATDLVDAKLELAQRLGADLTANPSRQDIARTRRESTGDSGFNAVIEAAGSPDALSDAFELVAAAGRIVISGVFGGSTYPLDPDRIVGGELVIRGTVGGQGVWEETIRLVSAGTIRTAPLISDVMPLSQVQEAFQSASAQRPDVVKLLLNPQE